jgi:uncharacterized protein
VNRLFADTSGWASLYISTERYHAQAVACFEKSRNNRQPWLTTNYVIAKLVALFGSRQWAARSTWFPYIDAIKSAAYVEVIYIDAEIDTLAWKLYKDRADKTWSLLDCSSFVLMQHLGIQDALTTDQHFDQAGFVRLLK